MKVDVGDLRVHLSRYLVAAREGAEFTVTDRGKAIARIGPLNDPRPLERLIRKELVAPASNPKRPAQNLRVKCRGTVSDLVGEQRR